MNSKESSLVQEFYYFRTLFSLINFLLNGFYFILLIRSTSNISTIFIHAMILAISSYAAYVIGIFLNSKIGYVMTYKLAFALIGFSSVFIFLNLKSIGLLYPLFAILQGFALGLFWPTHNNIVVKELSVKARNIGLSNIVSIDFIIQIVAPLLIGATITIDGDYSMIFLIAASIAFTSLLIPWNYNKKPSSNITSSEILKLLGKKKYRTFYISLMINGGLQTCTSFAFIIIPFLFLKNEFSLGIFMSVINLTAAGIAYFQKSKKNKEVLKTSYVGLIINTIANIVFIVMWVPVIMAIRGILSSIGDSLHRPLTNKMDVNLRENALGEDKHQSAAEMNILTETLFTLGRFICLGSFLIIYLVFGENETIFKIILLVSTIWNIFFFQLLFRLSKKDNKIFKPDLQEPLEVTV